VTSRARGIETADLGRMPEIGRSIFEFGASQRRIEGRSPETSAAFPHPDRIGHTRCELDHRAMCSSILGCRHVPDSGAEDVSSFGSSGAEHFDGMAQECVRWLPSCIGPRVVADPGSVTTVTRLTLGSFWPLSFALMELGYPCPLWQIFLHHPRAIAQPNSRLRVLLNSGSERRSGNGRYRPLRESTRPLASVLRRISPGTLPA